MRFFRTIRDRLFAAALALGGYDAAKRDRFTGGLPTSKGPDVNEDLRRDHKTLRARSLHLFQNNSLGRGIINAHVRHILRSPIEPMPAVKVPGVDGGDSVPQPAVEWNRSASAAWLAWSDEPRHCDLIGKNNFARMVKLALKTMDLSGEVFVVRHRRTNPDGVPDLRIELIDPAMLADEYFPAGEGLRAWSPRGGIEFDQDLRPIRYHFRKRSDTTETVSYDAADVLHLYRMDRPGQMIGEPFLTPVVKTIFILGQFLETELKQAWHNATIFGAIKSAVQGFSNRVAAIATNGLKRQVTKAETGTLLELRPGEEFQQISQVRPGAGFPALVQKLIQWISTAVQLPYSMVSGDTNGENYSRMKASNVQMEVATLEDQEYLRDEMVARVWEWVVLASINKGILPILTSIAPEAHYAARYRMPGTPYIDPNKDAQADETQLANYLTSPTKVASKGGNDVDEMLDDHAEFNRKLRERGLPPPRWQQASNPNPQLPEDESDEDGESEEDKPAPGRNAA